MDKHLIPTYTITSTLHNPSHSANPTPSTLSPTAPTRRPFTLHSSNNQSSRKK